MAFSSLKMHGVSLVLNVSCPAPWTAYQSFCFSEMPCTAAVRWLGYGTDWDPLGIVTMTSGLESGRYCTSNTKSVATNVSAAIFRGRRIQRRSRDSTCSERLEAAALSLRLRGSVPAIKVVLDFGD